MPRSSMTTMASGTVSRIDCRCASRASVSWVLAAARRRVRCKCSPPHAMPMPIAAKAAAFTSSGWLKFGKPAADEKAAEHQPERRRQQARAQSADAGCDQHGRHEKQIGRFVLQHRLQRDAGGKRERHRDRRQAVAA